MFTEIKLSHSNYTEFNDTFETAEINLAVCPVIAKKNYWGYCGVLVGTGTQMFPIIIFVFDNEKLCEEFYGAIRIKDADKIFRLNQEALHFPAWQLVEEYVSRKVKEKNLKI